VVTPAALNETADVIVTIGVRQGGARRLRSAYLSCATS
jgi:hypothetical protein